MKNTFFLADQKRILVAPLNWGLGHASRCIPIIHILVQQGYEVLLASDGRALQLLKAEFPNLPSFELPAYRITYRSTNMFWNIGWQLPKIIRAIILERYAIKKLVRQEQVDIIISDNRFGAYAKNCRNIFLTHQLHLKIPFRPLAAFVNWCNHFFICQFDECWIPDFAEAKHSLAGSLSHPILPTFPTHYLGTISRLQSIQKGFLWDIFILLSGPEPQRTFLERKIIEQLKNKKLRAILVQGKTEKKESYQLTPLIHVVSFMTSEEINTTAAAAQLMICRSGYSTVMDLYQLGKPAILIPTPGQTEQEYLAQTLKKKGIFYTQSQEGFDLKQALEKAKNYHGFNKLNKTDLKQLISKLI